jgi:RNA polymerase sigma-70 factor (ECF subfamily)
LRGRIPPLPLEYSGRDAAARFIAVVTAARPDRRRVIETPANGQPALAVYATTRAEDVFRALSLVMVTLACERLAAIRRFDASVLLTSGFRGSCPKRLVRSKAPQRRQPL